MFGTAQRIGLADSSVTEDMYSSVETEEELEELFNAGMNNGQDKEEANQQDRKDEDDNQTNDTSEEAAEKKEEKKVYCVICEKESSGDGKCSVCDQFVHAVCGSYSEDSEGFGQKVTCNICGRKNRTYIEREGAKSGHEQQAQKWFLFPTPDFQQLILGRTLWSGCLTLVETSGPKKCPSSRRKQEFLSCNCKGYCIDKMCNCRSKNIKCNSKCHFNSSCRNK